MTSHPPPTPKEAGHEYDVILPFHFRFDVDTDTCTFQGFKIHDQKGNPVPPAVKNLFHNKGDTFVVVGGERIDGGKTFLQLYKKHLASFEQQGFYQFRMLDSQRPLTFEDRRAKLQTEIEKQKAEIKKKQQRMKVKLQKEIKADKDVMKMKQEELKDLNQQEAKHLETRARALKTIDVEDIDDQDLEDEQAKIAVVKEEDANMKEARAVLVVNGEDDLAEEAHVSFQSSPNGIISVGGTEEAEDEDEDPAVRIRPELNQRIVLHDVEEEQLPSRNRDEEQPIRGKRDGENPPASPPKRRKKPRSSPHNDARYLGALKCRVRHELKTAEEWIGTEEDLQKLHCGTFIAKLGAQMKNCQLGDSQYCQVVHEACYIWIVCSSGKPLTEAQITKIKNYVPDDRRQTVDDDGNVVDSILWKALFNQVYEDSELAFIGVPDP